jgi:methylated-DNA-[protein]-cysteine S-methyltransferase
MQTKERFLRTSVRHPLVPLTLFARRNEAGLFLTSIVFSRVGRAKTIRSVAGRESNDPQLKIFAQKIREFLDGRTKSLDKIPLDMSWCTEFQKKVLCAARKIPRGETISYSELAERAGFPKAVRAAASVMRSNRFPLVIPCHRVIGKNGAIGGFMGAKTGRPVALKKKLLARERQAF